MSGLLLSGEIKTALGDCFGWVFNMDEICLFQEIIYFYKLK